MSANPSNEASVRRMARIAGLAYLIYSATGIYITFGPVPPLAALARAETVSPALDFMFRTGFLAEIILYIFVCVSAAAMYAVLRTVSRGTALTAAFCRLIEGAMGATFIIFKYAAFSAIMNPDVTTGLTGEVGDSLVLLLRDVYGSAIYFLLIPMAVGGVLYFALFFRARFIPRWLSAWGMLTYLIIGTVASLIVLYPGLEDHVMLFFIPGALFEWVVAVWLLFAGINTRHWFGREATDIA